MELWASPYKLRSRTPLSAKATSLERSGALLRVLVDGSYGYADLHPWPELGDLPLELQLSELTAGRTTPLSSRSLAFARLDRDFHARSESAYAGLKIPSSHFLITDLTSLTDSQLAGIWADGFRTLKLKLGRDLVAEVHRLAALPLSAFSLRFDFNGTLTTEIYLAFIDRLPTSLQERIEFIEDPMPWSKEDWQECAAAGIPLALDRATPAEISELSQAPLENPFSWCILKPAVQEPEILRSLARKTKSQLCVTSYMDHPLGQCTAAFTAAEIPEVQTCGLLTNFCLVENEWTERLAVNETRLVPPAGYGFGFDDLLAKENWKRIR